VIILDVLTIIGAAGIVLCFILYAMGALEL
jgi:hypothetical protein